MSRKVYPPNLADLLLAADTRDEILAAISYIRFKLDASAATKRKLTKLADKLLKQVRT